MGIGGRQNRHPKTGVFDLEISFPRGMGRDSI
jgi:hypothetical protein